MKKFDYINAHPCINSKMVLLGLVLATAIFVTNSKSGITLPGAKSGVSMNNVASVEIAVNQDGKVYINSVEYTLEKAELQLQLLSQDTPILLVVEETADSHEFIAVIDILNKFSLNKVSVLTRASN